MADFVLNAEVREDKGKGASRRLRRSGRIPGIIYGAGKDPVAISLDHDDLVNQLKNEAFYSHILEIKVGKKKEQAILKDLQRHVYKPTVVEHVDLQRVKAGEAFRTNVPLHFLNEEEARGVKEQGGVISRHMVDVEVSVLPKNLPEYIDVDLKDLELNENFHLSDIDLPEGVELVELMHDNDETVVSIHAPRKTEEEEPAEGEEEEGEEAADESKPAEGGAGEEGEGKESE